jgi:riboflavin synthase
MQIAVQHRLGGEPLSVGESVAVDGCCLTVTARGRSWFDADLSAESLERTGGRTRWRAGREVNLERALRLGDRLGGHLVQGHVDGLTRVLACDRQPDGGASLRFELPVEGDALVVEKGSIALDGISLTVARRGTDWFEVAVIPATWQATTLRHRRVGDALTVEFDILGKYAVAGRSIGGHADR